MAITEAEFIWKNGEFIPWADATTHVLTHAIHYGSSVFEGVRVYETPKGSVAFRLHDHMARLHRSAKIYRMKIAYDVETLADAAKELIRKNRLKSAYIRPFAYFGFGGVGVNPAEDHPIDVVMAAFPWGAYLGADSLEKGVDVGVSSWQRMAPNTVPTMSKAGGNYLSSMLVGEEARRLGYAEGIALDTHGYVSEGAGENIFAVINGKLVTPPVTSAILEGLTRHTIMTFADDLEIGCEEKLIAREQLYLADELFMVGTAAEIVPIRSVDGIEVGDGKRGPITKQMQDIFFGLFNGKTEDRHGWLTLIG